MFGRCAFHNRSLIFLSAIFVFFLSSLVFAAQTGAVKNDGAIVYRNADFDSRVIGYFRLGQKVELSSKKFGGAFYRVRFKQGVLGYIADSDVEVSSPSSSQSEGKAKKDKAERADVEAKTEAKKKFRAPVIQGRTYLGPGLGYTYYAEILNRTEKKDALLTYGLLFSFPIDTFFIDLSVFGTNQAPKFFKEMSTIAPQGYLVLGSAIANVSLFDFGGRRGLVFFGGGPAFAHSSYLVEVNSSKLDVTESRLGAVFNLGVAFDLGSAVFKLSPKFYVEKASYNSIDAALQIEL